MLTKVFRNTSLSFIRSSTATLRAPKKKKGAKAAAPTSSDIVNIFKDRKDPLIYPSDMYPPWVMGLLDVQYSPDDVMMQMYRGERLPNAAEQWRIANAIKRQRIKDRNFLKKQRLEYASDDDDFGEDLGGVEQEDLDTEVAGELEEK